MLTYAYGALPPVEGAEIAEAILARAHRFYNVLVEIERNRRARYREIERSVVPEPVARAVDDADARVADALSAIAAARAGVGRRADVAALVSGLREAKQVLRDARRRYREQAEPLRRASALVKAARGEERAARAAAHERDRDDAAIGRALRESAVDVADLAHRLHDSDARAAAEEREARSRSGLMWGTYTLVEAAVRQAAQRSPGDPKAPRYRHEYDGTGRIGANQLTGGRSFADLTGGADRNCRVEMVPLPDEATERQRRRRHAIVRIRVGAGEWIAFPVLLHRELPPGQSIREVRAVRRRIGAVYRWAVQFVVAHEAAPPAVGGRRAIAIDLGWRATDAHRVGYYVDSDGGHGAIRAPVVSFSAARRRRRQWAAHGVDVAPADAALVATGYRLPIREALDYLDGIRSVRDRHFDVARAYVRQAIAADGAPEGVRRQAATMHAWRSSSRLVGLLRSWEREDSSASILGGIRAWAARDRHLRDWEAHGRERVLLARREHYRCVAADIARRYDVVILESFDLREFARAPETEDGVPSEGRRLRRAMRHCAPSEFREAVEHAAGRDGRDVRHVDRAGTTETCHACGHVDEWTDPAALYHCCGGCGATWDRDHNAAVNLLRRAGYASGEVARIAA